MAPEPDLEELLNQVPPEERSRLEQQIREEQRRQAAQRAPEPEPTEAKEPSFARKAFEIGYRSVLAAGTTLLSSAFVGTLGLLTGGALLAGNLIGGAISRTKSAYEVLRDGLTTYSAVNAVISPIVALGNLTYPLIGSAGAKTAAALGYGSTGAAIGAGAAKTTYALTAYNSAFVSSFLGTSLLINNYGSPRGMGTMYKENFVRENNRVAGQFSVGYGLTANSIDTVLGLPVFPMNAFVLGAQNQVYPSKKNG